jgi:polar amino acid transport system substrate-binding protein
MTRTRTTLAAVLVLLVALLAGCSSTGDETVFAPATTQAPPPAPPTTAAPATQECSDNDGTQLRSYDPSGLSPPGQMPAGSYMAEIQARNRLIVGVSADTLLFGARNPIAGKLEGFDIDMVKEVALAIFGGTLDDIDEHIEYRVITYADRLPRLEDGSVDIVAHTMTINCTRWQRIAFSSQYFAAGQKVLVRTDSLATSERDLGGQRMCAAAGSTNIDNIEQIPVSEPIVVVPKTDLTDCLVAFQQGDVDAITGDDTVLAGFVAQDPYAKVLEGQAFTEEPYGLGINKDHVDFVRFVNAVLDQMRANGRWQAIYADWLGDIFDPTTPPVPAYGREP